MNATEQPRHPEHIGGYTYGAGEAAHSPLALADRDRLKAAVDFTAEDERYLHTAGDVLADQADEMVATWRKILTTKDFLRRKGHSAGEVERMHDAWTKAALLHVTLWTWLYAEDGDW